MVFSSPVFLFLFLPMTLLAVLLARGVKGKNLVLTAASLFFYAWGETFQVWLMLASILINYIGGRWSAWARTEAARLAALWTTVILNLLLLGWFKYANFVMANLAWVAGLMGLPSPHLDPISLPIGISFFTFQGLSYIIDVHRRVVPAQRRLVDLALYIALFPQLIAGPIVRYQEVMRQIAARHVRLDDLATGTRRFIIGLAKKLLVADVVARLADQVFSAPDALLPPSLAWAGALAFSIQIYFDFSGYSDMAIGLGRIFGFRFPENFDHPYIAASVRELWQRWHISLTTWFRDYVYIPLGGSRGGLLATYRNLLIVFLLTGLWHGASWNFVIWGLFHGLFMVLERLGLGRRLDRLPRILGIIYTLLIWNVSWAFFNTGDPASAWNFLLSLGGLTDAPHDLYYATIVPQRDALVMLVFGALASTPLPGRLLRRATMWSADTSRSVAALRGMADVTIHATVLLLCLMHMAGSTYDPFIYFRF